MNIDKYVNWSLVTINTLWRRCRKQPCDETPRDNGDDACFRNGRWRDEEEDTAMWAPVGACMSDSDKLVKPACVCDKMHKKNKSTPDFMLKSCFFSQDAPRRLLVTTRHYAKNNNNASSRQSVGWTTTTTTIKHYFTFLILFWGFFFISAQEHNKSPHLAKAKKIQLQTHAGPPYVIYTHTE